MTTPTPRPDDNNPNVFYVGSRIFLRTDDPDMLRRVALAFTIAADYIEENQ